MVEAPAKKPPTGCLAAVGVVGLLMLIGMCSSPKKDTKQSFASPSLTNQIDAMPTPAPAPIAALSSSSLRKGRQHLAAVLEAEGLSGAMIYSQNCYDALSRDFSWSKLDLCGGFDVLAVNSAAAQEATGLGSEIEYFGSEAAAGRYLALATKAGEQPGDADKRLEALQQQASALAPKPKASPTPAVDDEVIPAEEPLLDNDFVEEADV